MQTYCRLPKLQEKVPREVGSSAGRPQLSVPCGGSHLIFKFMNATKGSSSYFSIWSLSYQAKLKSETRKINLNHVFQLSKVPMRICWQSRWKDLTWCFVLSLFAAWTNPEVLDLIPFWPWNLLKVGISFIFYWRYWLMSYEHRRISAMHVFMKNFNEESIKATQCTPPIGALSRFDVSSFLHFSGRPREKEPKALVWMHLLYHDGESSTSSDWADAACPQWALATRHMIKRCGSLVWRRRYR